MLQVTNVKLNGTTGALGDYIWNTDFTCAGTSASSACTGKTTASTYSFKALQTALNKLAVAANMTANRVSVDGIIGSGTMNSAVKLAARISTPSASLDYWRRAPSTAGLAIHAADYAKEFSSAADLIMGIYGAMSSVASAVTTGATGAIIGPAAAAAAGSGAYYVTTPQDGRPPAYVPGNVPLTPTGPAQLPQPGTSMGPGQRTGMSGIKMAGIGLLGAAILGFGIYGVKRAQRKKQGR